MNKIKKDLYNRLYLEAQELKLIGNNDLANRMLKSIGAITEEDQNEESNEFVVSDILNNTKEDITEIIVQLCSDLNCNISSEKIDELSIDFTEELIKKIENFKE